MRVKGSAVIQQARILIAENECLVSTQLCRDLRRLGYVIGELAKDGNEAMASAKSGCFDLGLIDTYLGPGPDGVEVGAYLAKEREIPVIYLAAYGDKATVDRALRSHPDGFLVKPFNAASIHTSIQVALARSGTTRLPNDAARQNTVLQVSDLRLDLLERRAYRAGDRIELSPRELGLLEYLMRNAGTILSRDQIFANVWKNSRYSTSNVVEVYIGYLRNKIDRYGTPQLIVTRRGSGYTITDPTVNS